MAMLRQIVELLGSPTEAQLATIDDPRAVGFLSRLRSTTRVSPSGLDPLRRCSLHEPDPPILF